MRLKHIIAIVIAVVALNLVLLPVSCRFDLTGDHRYTLSPTTINMLHHLSDHKHDRQPLVATLLLTGELNSGFLRLEQATRDLLSDMSRQADIRLETIDPLSLSDKEMDKLNRQLLAYGFRPTQIYETSRRGQNKQTLVYPFLLLSSGQQSVMVQLLQNNPVLSGADNLNNSIAALEYQVAMGINRLYTTQREKICFLEGHGELAEHETYDLQQTLARYFDVYFGSLNNDVHCLDSFKCVIVASPEQPFTEADKYILDQYVMRGGKILWALNGVRFSEDILSTEGYTPVIPLDLNLQDMLFRYGVRINPTLLTDLQCLSIEVDISPDPTQPHIVPMPWAYSPLCLTSAESSISKDVMQVNTTFCSTIDLVGNSEQLTQKVLLASSNASHVISTPAEVDLSEVQFDDNYYHDAFVPVAAVVEGEFSSLFRFRSQPKEISSNEQPLSEGYSKQVFLACGSALANEWQQGQPLPLGYDRLTHRQWGNRDFLLNAVLYLTDDNGLIQLRQKSITLRMLNNKAVNNYLRAAQLATILVPLILLALLGICIACLRQQRQRKITNHK